MDLEQVINAPVKDPWLLGLSVLWFLNSCVGTWDKRLAQKQKIEDIGTYSFSDMGTKEHWQAIRDVQKANLFVYRERIIELNKGLLNLVSWLHLGLLIGIVFLNWQWALLLYIGTFGLAVAGVLELVGALVAKPFYRVLQRGIDY